MKKQLFWTKVVIVICIAVVATNIYAYLYDGSLLHLIIGLGMIPLTIAQIVRFNGMKKSLEQA